MPNPWEEIDTEDGESEEAPVVSEAAQRRAHLESLKSLGGDFATMASDLLDAMDVREAEAARQASALAEVEDIGPEDIGALMALFERERMDPEADPAEVLALQARVNHVKDGLRAQVLIEREETDRRVLAETEALLRLPDQYGSVRGDEEIARELAQLRSDIEATASFLDGSDALEDSVTWREYQWQRTGQERARALAEEMTAPSLDEIAAEAQESVAATLAGVLSDG